MQYMPTMDASRVEVGTTLPHRDTEVTVTNIFPEAPGLPAVAVAHGHTPAGGCVTVAVGLRGTDTERACRRAGHWMALGEDAAGSMWWECECGVMFYARQAEVER